MRASSSARRYSNLFRSLRRSALVRYGLALLVVSASLLVAIWLRPSSYSTPYLFFYPAVLVAHWFGRLGPGLVATVSSAVAVNYFQLPPYHRFSLDAANILGGLFYCVAFGAIGWFLETNRSRAEAAQIRVEAALSERESDLRANQEQLAAIIGSAMDAIITVDEDQRIVLFNAAAETIFRVPASEAVGEKLDRFIPQRFRDIHRTLVSQFGKTGTTTRTMYSPAALFGLRADGHEFPIEATISQITVSGKKLFTVILRDVTQRKQAEAALIRSEKLASLGRLAATVAHEINNPLEAVSNALYLAKQNQALNHDTRAYLQMAGAELTRAAQITKQTLGFSRGRGTVTRFRPTEVLESVLALFERKLRNKEVVCEQDYMTDSEISGVENEIRQVFWNLLNNSLEAVPPNGCISVRVSPNLRALDLPGVRITVADNGHGIAADHIPHLFEPFFTTKDTGNGLGLWVVSEIVNKHGGSIRVRSRAAPREPTGTIFSIFLPT